MGEHRGLVLEKVQAFNGNDVTSRIGTKHAAMQCNPVVYLTEFDDSEELLETVIAQVEEYLLPSWAGAISKPQARTFDQLHLQGPYSRRKCIRT